MGLSGNTGQTYTWGTGSGTVPQTSTPADWKQQYLTVPTFSGFGDTKTPEQRALDEYMKNMKEQMQDAVFGDSVLMKHLKEMSVKKDDDKALIDDVVAERKKDKVKALLLGYDWMFGRYWENGEMIRWTLQFKGDSTVYTFAAVYANNLWYTTDNKGCSVFTTEELVSRLIAEDLASTKVEAPVIVGGS